MFTFNVVQYGLKYIINITSTMKNQHLIKYKNPVILKDQEGKVKMTVYDLPHQKHTYGKKIQDDPEPIKYVVNGWKQGQTSDKPPAKLKDFKQLNKQAIHSNVHTAKDQAKFRGTMDIMIEARQGQKVIPIMLPSEQFTYGVPNMPSTPIKLVVGNCYAIDAESNNQTQYAKTNSLIQANQTKKVAAKTTKSQALREQNARKQKQYRGKSNIQQGFKLSKFTTQTITKVDTGLKPSIKQTKK